MGTQLRSLLENYGLIREDSIELFQLGTRDDPGVTVLRDSVSGLCFLDRKVDEDSKYREGGWLEDNIKFRSSDGIEHLIDNDRRFKSFFNLFCNRVVLDFGCGEGSFLKSIKQFAEKAVGVELNNTQREKLLSEGIEVYDSLRCIDDDTFDSVFLFQCFHYLASPSSILDELFRVLKPQGSIVVEVPNAQDFLIAGLGLESFKNFTYSSECLIMHSAESLKVFLLRAGLEVRYVKNIQRYNLANHIQWLQSGSPGGHKSWLNALFSDEVNSAYANALCSAGYGDTLIGLAKKP